MGGRDRPCCLTVLPFSGITFVMKHESNMTSKGQVTVPKDIRDALGMITGNPVRFEMDGDCARIYKVETKKNFDKADFLRRLEKARALFRKFDTMPGVSTDEYMAMIREPVLPEEMDNVE
jgi:bifunctional DNA-binding transcriptional regulator/antitoxin component of YhaV-PrlF toxin-antitoxin module